jgi:hypothetical protein
VEEKINSFAVKPAVGGSPVNAIRPMRRKIAGRLNSLPAPAKESIVSKPTDSKYCR